MAEPEISRRCITCGATVRPSAAFCPQCGQMLEQPEQPHEAETQLHTQSESTTVDETPIDEPPIDETPIDAPPADESAPTVLELKSPDTVIIRRDEELHPKPSPESFETRPLTSTQVSQMLETQPLHALQNATVSELPGAIRPTPDDNARPRNEPSVLGRVEKLRKASSVMIDQAAYDPSLRFLLVAAGLFLLCVLLMILSKVIG